MQQLLGFKERNCPDDFAYIKALLTVYIQDVAYPSQSNKLKLTPA